MTNNIGQIERISQNRIVKLFTERLGYTYYGTWEDNPKKSNNIWHLCLIYIEFTPSIY